MVAFGLHRLGARRVAPSGVILAYHNIVPRGEPAAGDLSLHLDQATFGDQLDLLAETYDVVTVDDLVATDWETSDRPRAALTFDDAYLGTLTAGVEELTRRGMPGTVMVAPGILGRPTWWDLLAPDGGGPVPDELREHCLNQLRGRQEEILAWAEREGLRRSDLPDHAVPASPEAVVEAGRTPGISLGAHTWSHPNLARHSAAECQDEYARCRAWLQGQDVRYSDWLAYPYGLYTRDAVELARTQFQGGLRVEGGLAWRRGQPTAPQGVLPRINIPRGMSLEGMRLRLTAFLTA
ncbi:MAG: polysaccharide deacetylase family protein [Gemmatimonadota bacterium]